MEPRKYYAFEIYDTRVYKIIGSGVKPQAEQGTPLTLFRELDAELKEISSDFTLINLRLIE